MTNFKARINFILAAVGLLVIVGSGAWLYYILKNQALEEVRRESLQQMAMAQAVRKYTSNHIREILLKDKDFFHSPAIPSYAAIKTMGYLKDFNAGFNYKEVALNPTNPANLAKGWEKDIINELRITGGSDISITTNYKDQTTYHYAKPIQVKDSSCLSCHGQASSAPNKMLEKYGSKNGFGWFVGEVVGAQIVSIPANAAFTKVNHTFTYYLAACGGLVIALLVALNIALSNMVIKPIQTIASEDGLTGAATRRSLIESFQSEIDSREGGGSDSPISLVMIDIDHFKRINDTHGHSAGDTVLKECCIRVRNKIRRGDLLGRLGGEEFAVMLPHTDAADALALASNLLAAIRGTPFEAVGTVTASLGVAQWTPGERVSDVLERADAALYASKHEGRDRVTRAKPR